MTTAREQFLAVLYTGPLLRADAIVVLCGEDAGPRVDVGVQLLQQNAAPTIVLTGGIEDPPSTLGAASLRSVLIGKGVSPDRIVVESESQNTHEQAQAVVALAIAREWKRLLVVASSYHMPRAVLTVLRALQTSGHEGVIRVCPVPASQSPWSGAPDGVTATRLALLASEMEKIDRYSEHVAGYAEGLDYLAAWEGK